MTSLNGMLIDENKYLSFDIWIKNLWNVGSKAEIYSKSSNTWIIGDIVRIFTDSEGEWLEVKYSINTVQRLRQIARYDAESIRPLSKAIEIYQYIYKALKPLYINKSNGIHNKTIGDIVENNLNSHITDEKLNETNNNNDGYIDSLKEIDRANITTKQYYNMEAKRYASDKWVRMVADAFVTKMSDIRTFQKTDVLLDIGCGPGITTLSIMNIEEKESNAIGSEIYMIDLSDEFIKIAKTNVSDIKHKKIFIEQMDVFSKNGNKTDLSMKFKELLNNKIEFIDCGYMSLVSEYLSKKQLIRIATEICNKLSIGGIFACLDWGEHLHYPPIYGNGLHWNRGITKKDWLQIAAEVVENIENGERILIDEKENKKKASRSEYTVTVWNSTFEIQLDVNDTNSYLHYIVFRKDKVKENVYKSK